MKLIAVYETDVQNDFSLRSGALFVHGFEEKSSWKPYGAEARLPNILKMHNYSKGKENIILMGSVDKHFYEDAELIRNKGGAFEDHCMNGTPGQLRVDGLERQMDIYIQSNEGPGLPQRILNSKEISDRITACLEKKHHLIFEKQAYDVGTNPNFAPVAAALIEKGLDAVVIDGFATDYCVKTAALRFKEAAETHGKTIGKNFSIYVVTDAIHEVNINFEGKIDKEFGRKALAELYAAGVKPIATEQVLAGGAI